jgi:prepilin signal peptidase PulO-like enzyme (type II secretory pathway)
MSAMAGLIVFFGLRICRTETDPEMPFGPMLSLGGLVFLLNGEGILEVVNRLVFIQ